MVPAHRLNLCQGNAFFDDTRVAGQLKIGKGLVRIHGCNGECADERFGPDSLTDLWVFHVLPVYARSRLLISVRVTLPSQGVPVKTNRWGCSPIHPAVLTARVKLKIIHLAKGVPEAFNAS